MDFFPPEQLGPLEAELAQLGYPQSAIEGIMGGNFLRVAEQVWRPPVPAGV
jgi:membrane dipeptidase